MEGSGAARLDALLDWRPTKWVDVLRALVIVGLVLLPGEILTRVVGNRTGMLYNGVAVGSFFGITSLGMARRGRETKNDSKRWKVTLPAAVVFAQLIWLWELGGQPSAISVDRAGTWALLSGLCLASGCFSARLWYKKWRRTKPSRGLQPNAQDDARG